MVKHIITLLVAFAFAVSFAKQATAGKAQAHPFHNYNEELKCLADNIYWEARNQSVKGMIGVALVTSNRVYDSRYPHTYCEVVQQGPTRPSWKDIEVDIPVRHKCQFSWYCDGKKDNIPYYDIDIYELAMSIAFKVYHNHMNDFTQGATHYHANYVTPGWATTKTMTVIIDEHIFYRWEK